MKYQPFAPRVLESISAKFVARVGCTLADFPLAMDIETMADNLGYQIVFKEKKMPGKMEACSTKSKQIFVGDGALEFPDRYRFTLAEELAHIEIHLPMIEAHGVETVLDAKFSEEDYERLEEDAKYLAGAILMDAETFRKQFYAHASFYHARFNVPDKKLRSIFRACASDFQVSQTCATRRGQALDLITKKQSIAMTT